MPCIKLSPEETVLILLRHYNCSIRYTATNIGMNESVLARKLRRAEVYSRRDSKHRLNYSKKNHYLEDFELERIIEFLKGEYPGSFSRMTTDLLKNATLVLGGFECCSN